MDKQILLLDGFRTPMATYSGAPDGGAFKDVSAVELGTRAAMKTLQHSGLEPERIDHVVFGNVIQSSPETIYAARHIGLRAGVPESVPALTVNRLCGSGIQSVISGVQEIYRGDASIVLAGGTEHMSRAPHVIPGARTGFSFGNAEIEDWLQLGLHDAYCDEYMAETSDNLADRYNISREEQDRYALRSHRLGAEAVEQGRFDEEIVPVQVRSDKTVERDDFIRPDTSLERLQQLPPAFGGDSDVTAGNASGIVDGGAAIIAGRADELQEAGASPAAEILDWSTVGVEPSCMGIGPAHAIPKVLAKTELELDDVDRFEINEAFAGQYLAVEQELDLDRDRVNVNGGAIALGHPLGMTGTRLLITLIRELRRENLEIGVASACIGGGQGIAMLVKRLN